MKKYMVRVGSEHFIFKSLTGAQAAVTALDMAEFVGRKSWRADGYEAEDPNIALEIVDAEECKCFSKDEAKKIEAINDYRKAVGGERQEKARDKLLELGIDPESIGEEE